MLQICNLLLPLLKQRYHPAQLGIHPFSASTSLLLLELLNSLLLQVRCLIRSSVLLLASHLVPQIQQPSLQAIHVRLPH